MKNYFNFVDKTITETYDDEESVNIKYKVKDEEGTVVDNKEIMLEIVDAGDTVEEESYIFNLDVNKSYMVEFVVDHK